MDTSDWLVNNEGQRQPLTAAPLKTPSKKGFLAQSKTQKNKNNSSKPYRLYRFLTDLETILDDIKDEQKRLQTIGPLVRKLLDRSPWLQTYYMPPPADPGWSVFTLYEEPDFPLAIQIVAWLPNHVSPVHNHGGWGLVALLSGAEKNTFWRRTPTPESPYRIEEVDTYTLSPGEIITFLPDAIHCVEPLGDEPAITFNIYGEANATERFEFDPINHSARHF